MHAAARVGGRRAEVEARAPRSRRGPAPGTGRKTSCWCSWAVPPPTAPPMRLALRASSSCGPSTRRARIRAAEPGGEPLEPGLHPVGEPLAVVAVPDAADLAVAGVGRGSAAGRGCRPRTTRCRRVSGSGRWWSSARPAGTAPPGSAPDATWPSASLHLRRPSRRRGRCPGAYAGSVSHGTGPLERPVDLHRAGVQLEPAHPADDPRRARPRASSSRPYRLGAATSAMHRAPGLEPLASAVRTPVGPPSTRPRSRHLGAAPQLAAAGGEAVGQRLGQPAGAALGHREADGLAEHRHQQPHQPRPGRVERDVGVAGVAGQQDGAGRRRRSGAGRARPPG